MKTFTLVLTAFFALYFTNVTKAQVEPVLTLVTTIDPKGAGEIVFEPEGGLEVNFWNNHYAQVTIHVEDNGFSRQQVKALVPLGIFKIEPAYEGNLLRLTMPGLSKNVSIHGKNVIGRLNFVLHLPTNIRIQPATAIPKESNL